MKSAMLGLLSLCSCVSNGTYEQLEMERDALQGQVAELEDRVAVLEAGEKQAKRQLDQIKSKLASKDKGAWKEKVIEARKELKLGPKGGLSAVLHTDAGDIGCELWPDKAPETVLNFVGLSEGTKEWVNPKTKKKETKPLYDGTVFHRVIKGFMIQGGDPLGSGRGGPGYRFGDEVHDDLGFDEVGLLAMANAGPGTNGSQFFITTSKPNHLNGKHTIFGRCDMEVVSAIEAMPSARNAKNPRDTSTPEKPVVVKNIEITRN